MSLLAAGGHLVPDKVVVSDTYEMKDKVGWVLSDFVESLKVPPSKLQLYILYWPPEPRVSYTVT